MLPRIRLLQVGDIHLARTGMVPAPIDDKDRSFPDEIRKLISNRPVKVVFRKIYQLLLGGEISSLIFMGDLAEKGNVNTFLSCIKYISAALEIGRVSRHDGIEVGLLPGNHDIDRVLATKPGLKTKFSPLRQITSQYGFDHYPIDSPVWIHLTSDNAQADVALLNSCWGCGSVEHIPQQFRSGISAAIEKSISEGVDGKSITQYYEQQLDTPAFNVSNIQSIIDHVNFIKPSSMVVVCAHHNLLPQRNVRLAPYTELVNSGSLRSSLLQMNRPILYLHGHIHDDPIEILSTPSGSPLISISAPEVSMGFNMIDIVYTRQGLPLSCRVTPWRFQTDVLKPMREVPIPLAAGRRTYADPGAQAIYQRVVEKRDVHWETLRDLLQPTHGADADGATEEVLELFAAQQLITIENYTLGREHWLVRSPV
jgi:hypothetical protein